MAGEKSSEKAEIKVKKIVNSLPADKYGEKVSADKNLVGLELDITNRGTAGLSISDIKYSSSLTDSANKVYDTVFYDTEACPSSSGGGPFAPGETRSVCFAFKIPKSSSAKSLRISYGFSHDFGIWKLQG